MGYIIEETLRKHGYDPNIYDIDNNGNVIRKAVSPTTNQSPDHYGQLIEQTGKFEALARGAVEGVDPTGVGIAGASLANAGLKAIAPKAHPALTVASIIAGGLASALGSSVQNQILGKVAPEVRERSQQAYTEHPYAYTVGSLASGLPYLGVGSSGTVLKEAGKGVTRLATAGGRMTNAETMALANAGLGAGIMGAIEGVRQFSNDEFSPGMLLLNIAGGAALNEPRPWLTSKKLGRFALSPTDFSDSRPLWTDKNVPKGGKELEVDPSVLAEEARIKKEEEAKVEAETKVKEAAREEYVNRIVIPELEQQLFQLAEAADAATHPYDARQLRLQMAELQKKIGALKGEIEPVIREDTDLAKAHKKTEAELLKAAKLDFKVESPEETQAKLAEELGFDYAIGTPEERQRIAAEAKDSLYSLLTQRYMAVKDNDAAAVVDLTNKINRARKIIDHFEGKKPEVYTSPRKVKKSGMEIALEAAEKEQAKRNAEESLEVANKIAETFERREAEYKMVSEAQERIARQQEEARRLQELEVAKARSDALQKDWEAKVAQRKAERIANEKRIMAEQKARQEAIKNEVDFEALNAKIEADVKEKLAKEAADYDAYIANRGEVKPLAKVEDIVPPEPLGKASETKAEVDKFYAEQEAARKKAEAAKAEQDRIAREEYEASLPENRLKIAKELLDEVIARRRAIASKAATNKKAFAEYTRLTAEIDELRQAIKDINQELADKSPVKPEANKPAANKPVESVKPMANKPVKPEAIKPEPIKPIAKQSEDLLPSVRSEADKPASPDYAKLNAERKAKTKAAATEMARKAEPTDLSPEQVKLHREIDDILNSNINDKEAAVRLEQINKELYGDDINPGLGDKGYRFDEVAAVIQRARDNLVKRSKGESHPPFDPYYSDADFTEANGAWISDADKAKRYQQRQDVWGVESLDAKRNELANKVGKPRQNFANWVKEKLAGIRGFEQKVLRNITTPRGNEVSGSYGDGKISISQAKGEVDTFFHENFHGFLEAMLSSPSKSDRATAERLINQMVKTPEFAEYYKAKTGKELPEGFKPIDGDKLSLLTEEFIAQSVAERATVKLFLEKSGLRNGLRDFMAHLRTRLSTGTKENIERVFANMMLNRVLPTDVKVNAPIIDIENNRKAEIAANTPTGKILKYQRGEAADLAKAYSETFDRIKEAVDEDQYHGKVDSPREFYKKLNDIAKSGINGTLFDILRVTGRLNPTLSYILDRVVAPEFRGLDNNFKLFLVRGMPPAKVLADYFAVDDKFFTNKEAHMLMSGFKSSEYYTLTDRISEYFNGFLPSPILNSRLKFDWYLKHSEHTKEVCLIDPATGQLGEYLSLDLALDEIDEADLVAGVNTSVQKVVEKVNEQRLKVWEESSKASNKPFSIPLPWREIEGVRDLKTPAEMIKAGKDQHHCLGCYVEDRKAGNSFFLEINGGSSHAQVRKDGVVLQHRAKYNADPPPEDVAKLKEWQEAIRGVEDVWAKSQEPRYQGEKSPFDEMRRAAGMSEEEIKAINERREARNQELAKSGYKVARYGKDSKVIAIDEVKPKYQGDDVRYLELAKDPEGNKEELQRMVDEAAKAAGYNVGYVYHGTKSDFNSFERGTEGSASDFGILGTGFYFSKDKSYADQYPTRKTNNRTIKGYLKLKNPATVTEAQVAMSRAKAELGERDFNVKVAERAREKLESKGYDGVYGGDNFVDDVVAFEPNQIKSADPVTYDDNGNIIPLSERFNTESNDIRYQSDALPERDLYTNIGSSWLRPFRPIVDKIASRGDVTHQYAARVLNDMGGESVQLYGKYGNAMLQEAKKLMKGPKAWLTGRSESLDRVYQYMLNERDRVPQTFTLTPEEQEVKDNLREIILAMHEERVKDGPNIKYWDKEKKSFVNREPVSDPQYIFHSIDDEVLEILNNRQGTPEHAKLINDYIEYQVAHGLSADEAKEQLDLIFKSKVSNDSPTFNPLRLPEGAGLPPSWRHKSFITAIRRYAQRYAADLAYYRHIQKDPVARTIFDESDDGKTSGKATKADTYDDKPIYSIRGSDEVKSIFRQITHDYPFREAEFNALNRLIKAGMMQTVTGVRDVIATPFIAMEDLRLGELPLMLEAIAKIGEGFKAGFEQGVIREGTTAWQDYGISHRTTFVDNLTNTINKVTGREWLEKVARAYTMELGRLVAESRLAAGDKEFFARFGQKDWEARPTDEVIDYAAARFVESKQGTYDYRGLPAYALEGQLSPLMSLAKWSIERLNNFDKSVIAPAKKGNIKPLVMATIGAAIGGEAIQAVVEMINDKKPEQLTWEEFLGLGGQDAVYRYAAIASAAGFAGILSDAVKSGADLYYGTDARGLTFPLVDAVAEAFARFGQAAEAIRDGESAKLVYPELALKILQDNIQLHRVALNQFGSKEEKIRKADLRDLRLFERIEEGRVANRIAEANPFRGQRQREFKRELDPNRVIEMLPEMISLAFERSKGDPYKLRRELINLKMAGHRVMPSLEESPMSFISYLMWLRKSQGEAAVAEKLRRYLSAEAIQNLRSELVPSI